MSTFLLETNLINLFNSKAHRDRHSSSQHYVQFSYNGIGQVHLRP